MSLKKVTPNATKYTASRLPECEGVRLRAAIEELDLELAINNRFWLPDQLIPPLNENRAVTALVDVNAMREAWWPAVDRHPYARSTASS